MVISASSTTTGKGGDSGSRGARPSGTGPARQRYKALFEYKVSYLVLFLGNQPQLQLVLDASQQQTTQVACGDFIKKILPV